MARRIHIPVLRIGDVPLQPAQAHHARDVLRLANGTAVEVFDDAGASAHGVLLLVGQRDAAVRIGAVDSPCAASPLQWTVASAVPKGDRADWMVEKLSELGAAAFIPLATARSVVLPTGKSKHERWIRIATEAAKQSRRVGVMRIEPLTALEVAVQRVQGSATATEPQHAAWDRIPLPAAAGWFLATEVTGVPIAEAALELCNTRVLTIFVGPEGGWTAGEIQKFGAAGIRATRLGDTVLRIETAAISAGAVLASRRVS